MPFVWNEDRESFADSDTGEELTLEEATELVDEIIDGAFDDLDIIIEEFLETTSQPSRWHRSLILLLEDTYLILAALGIGGLALLTDSLREQMRRALDRQFTYLTDFATVVAQGNASIGSIRQRSRMYINSSRQAYWLSRDQFERQRGMVEEQWETRGDSHVCSPCNDAEDDGFQPIGTFAQPGSGIVRISPTTMCLGLTTCRCRKFYR